MPRIAVLPPDLASQIAAGEVVDRPSSVVKELLENSLDAGATRCDVEIEGGGITSIAVADDGAGMDPDDARLSIERHATSKLLCFADLERLSSYGFRGEALPSIASVSRMSVKSRARDAEAGVEIIVEGGAPAVVRPLGLPPGTRVDVDDLFFNVPARRKFLRSSGTESGHVTEIVESAALTRPEVTFTLTRDARRVREFLRAKDREERVRQVAGDERAPRGAEAELAACRGERGPLRLEAFLSRPEAARAGAGGLRLLVNDRPVRDRALLAAIAQAYGSVLERGRYPRGVVYLDLAPELVDVNVHPQKAEVRFADARTVGDAVYGILSRSLSRVFSLPMSDRGAHYRKPDVPDRAASWVRSGPPSGIAQRVGAAYAAGSVYGSETFLAASEGVEVPRADDAVTAPIDMELRQGVGVATASPADERVLIAVRDSAAAPTRGAILEGGIEPRPSVRWASLRFVAQLRQTYLLCEGQDGLYLLDQHAAAERVTFTRLRREYQSRSVPSQALLFPVTVEVTAAEAELVEERRSEIAEVGLDARARGPELVSIHAVPRLLQRASAERLLRDLLSEVSRSGGRGFSNAVDLVLATMACHGSVRAGDPLSATEVAVLLTALDEADFAGHCPHGRPVVTFTSWSELERKVGRR
jgi:DNA mismatch repair protein MutL